MRSLSEHYHSCHSGKGSNICMYSYLILIGIYTIDVMNDDNHAAELSAQIQVSIALIGKSIVLAKRGGTTLNKVKKIIKATTQRGILTMLHHSDDSEQMIQFLSLHGTSSVFRDNYCKHSVQKG